MVRSLYDCPDVPMGPAGLRCRVVVATHPAGRRRAGWASTRAGVVYELFLTNLPQGAFTAADVVALYLHRGAFELRSPMKIRNKTRIAGALTRPGVKSAGRSSANGCGTSAWNWAISLHQAGAHDRVCSRPPAAAASRPPPHPRPRRGMGRQTRPCPGNRAASLDKTLLSSPMARCAVQPDSRFRARAAPRSGREPARGLCGQHPQLSPLSLARAVSMARAGHRQASPGERAVTSPGRRLLPLCSGGIGAVGTHRRACLHLVRANGWRSRWRLVALPAHPPQPVPLSRAQRAHCRLSWAERLTRNARPQPLVG